MNKEKACKPLLHGANLLPKLWKNTKEIKKPLIEITFNLAFAIGFEID
jgi:hypothetical protein